MIESMTVRDFQIHRRFLLEFDPHINTIVGRSDVGKSSLIRALRWVCLNQPQGKHFVRHGANEVSVELEFDKGRKLVRSKGDSGNTYHLDGKRFATVDRTGVPEEVQSLLGVTDVNFQTQFSNSFWISDSAGKVSRELNAIVDLGIIDETIGHVSTELRKANAEVELTEARLAEAQQLRQSLSWVRGLDEALQNAEAAASRVEQLKTRLGAVRELQASISEAKRLRGYASQLGKALAAGKKALSINKRLVELGNVIEQLNKANETLIRRPLDLSYLTQLKHKWDGLINSRKALAVLVADYHNWNNKCQAAKEEVRRLKDQLERLTDGEVCPLCKKPYHETTHPAMMK